MTLEFRTTPLPGAFEVNSVPHTDERGSFVRTFDREAFQERGLDPSLAQASISTNTTRGTLRGMHYQSAPHREVKLVRCIHGAVYDVIVDLRPDSGTYRGWHGVTLSATNNLALYVPAGFAHGYLTLEPGTALSYQISTSFRPESARGFRWDDPLIGIEWPGTPDVISDRDAGYPDLSAERQ